MTPFRRRSLLLPGALAALGAALVVAASWGGAVTGRVLAGLPDAGPLTAWGLPATRAVVDLGAVLTIGWCVTAAFLLPGTPAPAASKAATADGTTAGTAATTAAGAQAASAEGAQAATGGGELLGAAGYRLLRAACWWAALWSVASLALLVLTLSDLLGRPVADVTLTGVRSLAFSIPQGRSAVVQAVLAAGVAVACRLVLTRTGAGLVAVVACVAALPPALTGHAAGAGNHQLAVTSLAVHILAAAVWVGGLGALFALRSDRTLAVAARGYSRVALLCWAAVAVSGLANAAVRLGAVDQLWQSRYGLLVVVKTAALVVVGLVGAVHRARTLPALSGGTGGAFRRWAAAEVLVLAGTMGVAVALSRTPPPVPEESGEFDPVTDLLGFAAPGPISARSLVWPPLLDAFFLTLVLFGAAAYLTGVWRMRRAGHRWPAVRTASWLAGLAVLAAATVGGGARYAYVLFSAHMVQHLVLGMVVPILLVGGAPVTLALRTLRPPPHPEVRGARDWLLLVLHSRVTRTLTHPLVALGIYVVSLYGLYLTDLLDTLMRSHLGHLAMLTHFVLAGFLFFWVLIGVDPGRRAIAPPILVALHFAGMAFHAFLGVILLQTRTVIAEPWYRSVDTDPAVDLLADQRLAAGIAWAFGEAPAVVILALLVARWIRADEREQRRLDRAADRAEATGEEDDLARYNDFLRRANAAAGDPS
ncbi:cytochrome c oxidase assembly protein [Virgisporangium ochraceum]|uniref:Copper resistance protein D n=1 Tax=Virgisporangium ochraceum TaxID=65505 RepID=A0A8J4EFP8_9ACTN|nr:cytochrome c oxidase assembly protein [Virgisporangium ochraceum]GIJ72941.1 copper resistance protein D [Virgisporangium ochraceum]